MADVDLKIDSSRLPLVAELADHLAEAAGEWLRARYGSTLPAEAIDDAVAAFTLATIGIERVRAERSGAHPKGN